MAKQKKKQKRTKGRGRRLAKWALWAIAGAVILLAVFASLVYIGVFGRVPTAKDLTGIRHDEASLVYTADDRLIGKFYAKNRTNISFDSLPQHLVEALIATEDARFYDHNGIDNWAMLRVVVKGLLLGNRNGGGGSTITQQLAKNLYGRKNFGRFTLPINKMKEMIVANRLENVYEKNEIIELYLNTVPFGEEVYGIGTASFRYFNKEVQDLTIGEAAVLVGILKANTYYNPHLHPDHALQRRNVVLGQMTKYGYLDREEANEWKALPLGTTYSNLNVDNPNGYFLERVEREVKNILSGIESSNGQPYDLQKDGLVITTTLNAQWQEAALDARKQHLKQLQQILDNQWPALRSEEPEIERLLQAEIMTTAAYRELRQDGHDHAAIMDSLSVPGKRLLFNWDQPGRQEISLIDSVNYYLKMLHSSVFAMDPHSGEVKVYVGGNSFSYLPYDLVQSKRQGASAFKPFVYTAAISHGLAPCAWIDNKPKVYAEYSNWTPQNYDDSKEGYYSVRGALAKSMNIPTVAIYFAAGHEAVEATFRAFGFDADLPAGPSVALGSESVSLNEMVRGYAVFANGGQLVEPVMVRSIANANDEVIYRHEPQQRDTILEEETATIMQQMLKGVVDSGTATALRSVYDLHGEWGGKTGTSQNYGDAWFIGFNPNIVAGVWVGARYPSVHFTSGAGSGSSAALPIFGKMMAEMRQENAFNASFPKPSEAISQQMDCPFYRDKRALEKVGDFFDRITDGLFRSNGSKDRQKKKEKQGKKDKGGFLKRLFGGDDD